MPPSSPGSPDADHRPRDERVADALRGYLEAEDAGRRPDRAALFAAHPDLAADLATFFTESDELTRCAAWLDGPVGGSEFRSLPWRFAGYELLEEIGRGGMGVVYKARQLSLNRVVAVKLLRVDDPEAAKRLLAEARAAARLDHPGIVPVYEVGEYGGRPFLAMAYAPGGTLASRVSAGPVPPLEAARLMRDVARAVYHAHEQGVIHRDLKPGNILLQVAGQEVEGRKVDLTDSLRADLPAFRLADLRPMVADFGLAKRSNEDTLTPAGGVLGTPAYMPPEFAAGRAVEAGPAADVYGLGATLYALLTGAPPFAAPTPVETLRRLAEEDPAPPGEVNPAVDAGLQAVCLKCLEKDPRHRYR
ncbi:MAG: serine/threonine protein kinase, partial [Gemmataceae bacterium]|nr:serine/threonine protein kinase [Gemmataceae bacterium]